jgi:hypothetical protein
MWDFYRGLLKWTRTFHIYLALLGLLLVLFFAATGFMLNHPDWFGLRESQVRTEKGTLPVTLLEPLDKLMVVERLRNEFGVTGAVDMFEVEETFLRIVFKSAGRQTEAMIQAVQPEAGQTEVTYEWVSPDEDELGREAPPRTAKGKLPAAILKPLDRQAVLDRLRDEFGATGNVESFEVEDDSPTLRVVFKSDSQRTEATIQAVRPEAGQVEVTYESWGLVGRLTDLHRGKGAGPAWELIIDTACVVLLCVSATGLLLWTALRKRRLVGLLALTLGCALCLTIYFAFVP